MNVSLRRLVLASLAVGLAVLAGAVLWFDDGGFRGVAGYTFPDGRRYVGTFQGGLPHGRGA